MVIHFNELEKAIIHRAAELLSITNKGMAFQFFAS
jgi:hypothetical protein